MADPIWHNGAPNPILRTGLFHFDRIAPAARIARGTGAPAYLRPRPQKLADIRFSDGSGALTTLAEWLAASETDGYLVLHHGDIVMEWYCNGLRAHTRHNVMSISKSMIGTLAMLLLDQGIIGLGTPVIDYIPQLADSAYAAVTIGQVLNMTSGVAFNANTADPVSDVIRLTAAIGWRATPPPQIPPSLRVFLQSLTLQAAAPGTEFAYNDADTEVLAWVLERATGIPIAELLSRELWIRIGAEYDAEISLDPAGVAVASAGISLTLRDLARFAQFHRQAMIDDRRFAAHQHPSQTFDNRRNHIRATPLGEVLLDYRQQYWIFKQLYAMLGNNGQSVMVVPVAGLIAVKLSSIPNAQPEAILLDQYNAYQAACAIAAYLEYPAPEW